MNILLRHRLNKLAGACCFHVKIVFITEGLKYELSCLSLQEISFHFPVLEDSFLCAQCERLSEELRTSK